MSVLGLVAAVAAPSARAEEPAPPSESPVVAPDPDPDPAPPRTSPRPKPVVKAAPPKAVTVTRSPPVTSPAVAPTTPSKVVPVRRVRHRPPPARPAKRPARVEVEQPQPVRARPRRELPFASFVPARAVAASAAAAPAGDPNRIDVTWPAIVALGGALAAAAAAAASAVAPSFRLALAGGLAGATTRMPQRTHVGHIERRVRRPRARTPAFAEPPAPDRPAAQLEPGTFEIEWFRGYVKSRFLVLLEEPDGEQRLVESPWFAWRRAESPPPVPEFVAARDALLAKLEREGWHECGHGRAWYGSRVSARRSA